MAITKPRRQEAAEQRPGGLPITTPGPRRQRRPALAAGGLALAALGMLGAYTAVQQAGDRVGVLALAHAVTKGQTITSADLTVAQVAPDPALRPVSAARAGQVVGKVAAVDLLAGTLLTSTAIQAGASPGAGRTLVGVLAKPGMIPVGTLGPGDDVTVVATPGSGAAAGTAKITGAPQTIDAIVVSVSAPDANNDVVVDLGTDPADAAQVAAWASTGNIAILKQGS